MGKSDFAKIVHGIPVHSTPKVPPEPAENNGAQLEEIYGNLESSEQKKHDAKAAKKKPPRGARRLYVVDIGVGE